MDDALTQLRERLAEIHDLGKAAALLSWDQQTYMPRGAVAARAEQLATLSRLSHALFIDDATGRLLDDAAPLAERQPYDSDDASLVRVARRDYEQARRLPSDFVGELSRAGATARGAWQAARQRSDFAMFQPHLERIVALVRRQADYLGYADHPYDALLDLYEPEMRAADVRRLFAELREGLAPLVKAVAANPAAVDDALLREGYDEQTQIRVGEQIIGAIGFDFERGRQDFSAHPFCTSFAPTDVRITTRVSRDQLNEALFGTLHEMGHALYEQGVSPSLTRTLLARGASLGIHESQSRMWENLVGRSRAFWQHFLPLLRRAFPEQLGGVDLEQFYRAINRSQPSLIRVEADELTYNLHVMLRFELELALLEGQLAVADLPGAWNELMGQYLGVTPPSDALGVLQDVHWSGGMIGYFPTYTLGNVISAQLFERARADLGDLDGQIAAGELGGLLGWLRRNVHAHGRKFTPNELLQRVVGGGIQAGPYLAYLRGKFGELYGLTSD
ncbi:MAG: carboxypeptidase M32 [Kouleothrix sp.]|nr:carboxypeptidase M32 [Kouleothrix sp.]